MADSIRRIIDKIIDGEIRIPQFQRGYVWTAADVAWLMDSIYKRFPIGTILLWKTRERLAKERSLGPFELPDKELEGEILYVLDGQQRLTSLFGVFQKQIPRTVEAGTWLEIYFDLEAPAGAIEEQFVALDESDVDPARHFPISTIFDSTEYRKATEPFDEEQKRRIDGLAYVFIETQIPIDIVETKSRDDIAVIFDRINRAGRTLDDFELLTAWTWSEEFDLRDEFNQLASDVADFGFGDIGGEPNILIKCCAAVVSGNVSPSAIIELHGPTVRNAFASIKKGVMGAIDFLRDQLNVHSLRVLPYPSMIIPLCTFFATDAPAGIHPDNQQRQELVRWFWRSCFSRRYSSSVNTAFAADIAGMNQLRDNSTTRLSNFACVIDGDMFGNNTFTMGSVNTSTFILLMAQASPRSLLSGAQINVARTLTLGNRAEFHHIFPKAFLERQGVPRQRQNILGNFCFLSNADNQSIKDKDPSQYAHSIPKGEHDVILESLFIPHEGLNMQYDEFLAVRIGLLVEAAGRLIA